ncbi:MAG: ABC transporter permease [Syntrophomonadaceae bacterium]|jgi:ribose/xylose/arabinose/galactoside ABC-type transport system permease subunit|nr:ABC transporter permease [Syntrophomonadaceae bacterium]
MAIQSPTFLTSTNLFNIFLQASITTVIATGMTIVILTGGIDLSVGSIVALVAVTMGTLMRSGSGVFVSILIGLIVGVLAGFVNGFIVSKGKVPAFISTLGMMSVARGLALVVTNGQTIHMFPKNFRVFGTGYIGRVPVPAIIAVSTIIIAHFFLTRTRFGRYIYAVGGNREAVHLSGINVAKVETLAYMISGLLCGVASVILVGRLNSAQPIAGYGYEMNAIAASVIGGTSMSGGEGSVFYTLIGALIIGVLQNGLTLLNVTSYVQQIVIGSVIVVAVFADQLRRGNVSIIRSKKSPAKAA